LVLARQAPARVAGVFFFACNTDPGGTKAIEASAILDRCFRRHTKDYAELSTTPDQFKTLAAAVGRMQKTEPNYSARDLAEIHVPVAIESAVETGRDEVRLEVGGIDKQKWDELAAPIEARHAAPWLRRRGAEVHVVDLERRVERKPTDEELATGIFAANHDEYMKEQATVPVVA
jgi:hypothetical protein